MADSGDQPPIVDPDEVAIVLAAIDTSALTAVVVENAARVARRTWPNAHLHLLHVFRAGPFDRPGAAGLRSEDLIAEAQSHLDFHVRMAQRQCPSPVTGHLAVGDPVDEILKRARSLRADVLIVGVKDEVGLQRFLLGSVAEKVAKRAPCSVLMIRRKQRLNKKVS
jgi:nucleotide-binding universal stress UspA family protein